MSVLAPSSKVVDSVILSTRYQHKFLMVQKAIFKLNTQETIPFNQLVVTLHRLHINVEQLNYDMRKPAIISEMLSNLKYYSALGIHQIPVVLIFKTGKPKKYLEFIGSQSFTKLNNTIQFFNNNRGP